MSDASYRSFVVRVWDLHSAQDRTRVEIERVQSGEKQLLRGPAAEQLARVIEASSMGTRPQPPSEQEDEQ